MDDYNAANHDFTIRHALHDLKNNPSSSIIKQNNNNSNSNSNSNSKLQHLWNTATSPSNKEINKSRSEPNIQSNAVLEATQSFAKIQSISSLNANNTTNSNNNNNNKNGKEEESQEYDEESAKNIIREFVTRFPIFKSKLSEQFPNEWLNPSEIQLSEKPDPHQLFQFSQLERTEKERIIQEIYECPAQK